MTIGHRIDKRLPAAVAVQGDSVDAHGSRKPIQGYTDAELAKQKNPICARCHADFEGGLGPITESRRRIHH